MTEPSSIDPLVRLQQDIAVVLVQPQHPGNVGAAARAMANMGLRRLVVVDPAPSFDPETVRWLAPGSDLILAQLRVVPTLEQALEDTHLVLATSARHRRHQQLVFEPSQAATYLLDAPAGQRAAILFGREDFGLPAEVSQAAAGLIRIPTEAHASLNLGQAVLLIAHHLFEEARRRGVAAPGRTVSGRGGPVGTADLACPPESLELATVADLTPFIEDTVTLLRRVGYARDKTEERLRVTLWEGFQRAQLTDRQLRALRGVTRRVTWALDHPERDPSLSRSARADEAAPEVAPNDDAT